MPKGLDHRLSTDSVFPHYPVGYDPGLETTKTRGGMSLPRPGTQGCSRTSDQDKYSERKIPGYTGYIPGAKFGMARTPYPTQIAANVTLARDKVTENDERKEFGFDPKKNLPNPKGHAELPNLHPDEHSFMNCRPPVAVGNPSNRHNMTFGDNRIAGTYSNKTYYRDTFRGPRPPCKILGEGNLTDIYRTPEERKNAYERALLRIGKQKVEALLKTMSDRITAKLGNNGASAFSLRQALETVAGTDGVISIDEFRHLFMIVVGITLNQDELLALYGIYDQDGSGYCDISEMMKVLLDSDYFQFFLGNNIRLEKELTRVTETDSRSIAALIERIETIGNMQKVFLLFDANNSGRICRSEFQLACEKLNCPLTPAGTEVMWRKAEASGHEFVEFDELCRMFTADYKDYITNSQKLAQSSNSVSSLAAHVGPAIERAEQHYAYN